VSGYSDLAITPAGAIGVHFVYAKGTAFMTIDPQSMLRVSETSTSTSTAVKALTAGE